MGELLALVVVPQVRNVRRRGAEAADEKTVVLRLADARCFTGPGLNNGQLVAARAQPARQLVGAPSAAAAVRRERVGRYQHTHCALRMASSSARQCADQL